MVPVNRVLGRVSHGGQEDSTGVGLGIKIPDMGAGPRFVALEVLFAQLYGNGAGRAKGRTAATADAIGIVLGQGIFGRDIGVDLVGALTDANLATDAFTIVTVDKEFVE
jgi:hypothetical protein